MSMLKTSRHDTLHLGDEEGVSQQLYHLGESTVEWSDSIQWSEGEGGAAISMAMTRYAIYLLINTNGWELIKRIQLRDIERVTWDAADHTSVMFSLRSDHEKPFLCRCSEGSKRYHLHSLLRDFYETETVEPLPSVLAPCDVYKAGQRKIFLKRINQASKTLPPHHIEQLSHRIYQAGCEIHDELDILCEIAVKLERNCLFKLETTPEARQQIESLTQSASVEVQQAASSRDMVTSLTAELAEIEFQAAKARAERDVFKAHSERIHSRKDVEEQQRFVSLELYTRKLLSSECNSRLAGLQLASVRVTSTAMIKQREQVLQATLAHHTGGGGGSIARRDEEQYYNINNHLKSSTPASRPSPVVVRSRISLADLMPQQQQQQQQQQHRPATPSPRRARDAAQRQKTEERLKQWRSRLLQHT
eukprot:TRINITY_DN8138_c4_g1_i1.p1 TRINITY_DN8138_c4_g1~~TRINITY_DN8138_c4_g1_i1.p1  ORF type:complete len:428 (+),score=71.35 TRINITY_DN8138_c4_g1_i1:29-1285(+)